MNEKKAKKELIEKIQDKSLTTKERGDALEDFIYKYLKDYNCGSVKKTKGSGALHGDGDIVVDNGPLEDDVFDGKVKGGCTSVSVPAKELIKIRRQAAKSDANGIIVVPVINEAFENNVELFAVISLEDFMNTRM
jgi:hypothetical protein